MSQALRLPDRSKDHLGASLTSAPRFTVKVASYSKFVFTATSWAFAAAEPMNSAARMMMHFFCQSIHIISKMMCYIVLYL